MQDQPLPADVNVPATAILNRVVLTDEDKAAMLRIATSPDGELLLKKLRETLGHCHVELETMNDAYSFHRMQGTGRGIRVAMLLLLSGVPTPEIDAQIAPITTF